VKRFALGVAIGVFVSLASGLRASRATGTWDTSVFGGGDLPVETLELLFADTYVEIAWGRMSGASR
jgi:hypothetical protein